MFPQLATIPTVPTNISEFNNDVPYASENYVTQYVAQHSAGEKEYAVNSTDYNVHYFGTAPEGTETSATGWTIAKIVQSTNGTTTTTHAIGIFDNRESLNYT